MDEEKHLGLYDGEAVQRGGDPGVTSKRGAMNHRPAVTPSSSAKDYLFKSYVIIAMTIVWSAYSISIRYTRTRTDLPMYHASTVVVLSEFTKFCLAGVLLLQTHKFDSRSALREFRDDFIGKPRDLLKMAVPSLVYALQNNLDFVALSNLEPGVYQVTIQLKVVTTAIFMVIMLRRRYSLTRWFAILLLFAGVALIQLDAVEQKKLIPTEAPPAVGVVTNNPAALHGDHSTPAQNYVLGLLAVLTTCVTAGFAGVYFEKMLKNAEASLWIRNLQMYFTGVICASVGCLFTEGREIWNTGFFQGYSPLVWLIVGLLSVGGIFISMVMKYLDNLLKSFASAVSISLVCLLSYYLFGTMLGMYFILGTAVVCGSILLYNYVNE